MRKMTEQHLINAFGGESQAQMRYMHFANQAEKEKFNIPWKEKRQINVPCTMHQKTNLSHLSRVDFLQPFFHLEGLFRMHPRRYASFFKT